MDAINRVNTKLPMAPMKAAAAPAPQAEAAPAEAKDSFVSTVLSEARESAVKVGNITSSSVGGALGIAGLTAGLYAGAAGGALFL